MRSVTQRLYVSARDGSDSARTLREAGRELPAFLDEAEARIFAEALETALEGRRARPGDTLNHQELRDQVGALQSARRNIATSGSLLLQDYVAPHLAKLIDETEAAEHRLGIISRPNVSVRLETARLPLRATAGTLYTIKTIASNTGNATAERVQATITQPELCISSTATLESLGAGSEGFMEVHVEATGAAPPAVSSIAN